MSDARVGTGSGVLDTALNGGLPERRAILVTGGPGTGKSTLSMQFLQEGLENGERCLFVSTEQQIDELRDSFSGFGYELDHEGLSITTVHATPGHTLQSGEKEELVLSTLDGEQHFDESFAAPFKSKYIKEHLRRFKECDRVVIDSLSGLKPVADTKRDFDRVTLDLIQLCTTEFGATTLLTSEQTRKENEEYNRSQFKTHGVLQLWRQPIEGEQHRFIEILKMRGVDHDMRRFEVHFTDGGIKVAPRRRVFPNLFDQQDFVPTGIDGLDSLLGGGLLKGATTLVEHDGDASVHAIIMSAFKTAIENDAAITFVPSVNMSPERLANMFDDFVGDVERLLDDDRLFVIDTVSVRDDSAHNVFTLQDNDRSIEEVLETIDERRGDRAMLSIINTETMVQSLNEKTARRVRYWSEANLLGQDDITVNVHNPKTMDEKLAEFYHNSAWQVCRTWLERSGLQYVKVDKSPNGVLGSTRLVEYIDDSPYMKVLRAPSGTN